jgi:hypothetical protein
MVVVVQSAGSGGGGGMSHFVLGGQLGAGAVVAVQVVLGMA